MFSVGLALIYYGYAAIFTAVANLTNGGNGPTLSESLGFKTPLIPPGSIYPGAPPGISSMGSAPAGGTQTGGGLASGPGGVAVSK